MAQVIKSLGELFDVFIQSCQTYRFKSYLANRYRSMNKQILNRILKGPLIHIDETEVKLRRQSGYVWVLTNMDSVYYLYRSSREASFLHKLLAAFSGILVSDFFTGYDSLPFEQQKCLVHLVREMDDDLLRKPFDDELKAMAQKFGTLLKSVMQTVDHHGLKRRYLGKHKKDVARFLKSTKLTQLSSESARRFQNRFEKYGERMFTFLGHDGVPWNNNNAEHAIKRFANYRRNSDGRFTKNSLNEYLVLASVLETCEINNVNVLKFLLSKKTNLIDLFRMAGRKPASAKIIAPAQSDPPPNLPPDVLPPSGDIIS